MSIDNVVLLEVQTPRGLRSSSALSAAGSWIVGRDESATLVLADPSASSHHATVDWTQRPPRVRDEGSTHGTFLHESRVGSAWVRWPANTPLWCGSTRLEWAPRAATSEHDEREELGDDETVLLPAREADAFASRALLRPPDSLSPGGPPSNELPAQPASRELPPSASGADASSDAERDDARPRSAPSPLRHAAQESERLSARADVTHEARADTRASPPPSPDGLPSSAARAPAPQASGEVRTTRAFPSPRLRSLAQGVAWLAIAFVLLLWGLLFALPAPS